MKGLLESVRSRGLYPQHVAEVGVFSAETCTVQPFAAAGIRTTLVEGNPACARTIADQFAGQDHVTLHAVAVHDHVGDLELVCCGPSTFVADGALSPALVNDGAAERELERVRVPCTTFDQIDDGTIDLLCIDVEGCEWYVLDRLVSRPAVIAVETHGGAYVNPKVDRIRAWMQAQGYQPWMMDKSDTVYADPARVSVGRADRIRRAGVAFGIALRRCRKRLAAGRPS